ncbi:MAG: GNAT family N-acetyltransferase [Chloroflexota bacterium]|jgi:putative acetyltransferase
MIRPLHPDDASALHQLFHQPTPLSCDYFEPDAGYASFRDYTEMQASDKHRLAAVEDGRLVGLGVLEQSSRARMAHQGQIRLLMPPEALVSDAARDLLSALVELADNWLNLRRLEANSPIGIPALEALLRQFGFEPEGLMRKTLGPGPTFGDELALARLRGLRVGVDSLRPPTIVPPRKQDRRASSKSTIRPMASDDIEALYEVFRAPENCRTTLQLPSQELWLTRQRVLDPPAGMIRLVAECDGRAIGMISLRPRRQPCRAHIGGIGMMVHPDYWGLGIGSSLMEAILDWADRKLSLTRIELQVHTDNAAGIRLYEKFGFAIEGTKRFQTYGDGGWIDTYFMARIIG